MIVPTEHQEMVMNPMAWAGPINEKPYDALLRQLDTSYAAHNSGLRWVTEL